jgi:benzoyl-CoA-dihydrodiol lyase
VSSRSLFALIDENTCFAGCLAEFAFMADRTYMLSLPDSPEQAPKLTLSAMNFGLLPMITGQSRIARRFYDDAASIAAVHARVGEALHAEDAMSLGLITADLDDIDWADEIRLALEERASMSPDALTGLEANLRFNGKENMATRVFGRLSAWQNWIFIRPNAVGESGALKVYGSGSKAKFNFERI